MNIFYGSDDPRKINLNYTIAHGNQLLETSTTFALIDDKFKSSIEYGVIYGIAIGACLISNCMMWIMTRNKKTPMFVLNQIITVLMIIRASLYITYLVKPLSMPSFMFTGSITQETQGWYKVTLAANSIQTLLVASIEALMAYQVFIIFRSPEVRYVGRILTTMFGVLGSVVVGFYINWTVKLSLITERVFTNTGNKTQIQSWESNIPFILFSSTINLMSITLSAKLFLAIRSRRYLGLRQFDSFHILFIMVTQIMLAPAILVIINYAVSSQKYDKLNAASLVIIVLSLPLASMWATSANNKTIPTMAYAPYSIMSSSDVYSSSIPSSKYCLFPEKLSTSNSADSSKFLDSSPKTLVSSSSNENFGLNCGYNKNHPSKTNEVERIINQDLESLCQSLNTLNRKDSVDIDIENVTSEEFISVMTHNMK